MGIGLACDSEDLKLRLANLPKQFGVLRDLLERCLGYVQQAQDSEEPPEDTDEVLSLILTLILNLNARW